MSDSNFFSRLLRKNIWIYFFSFLIAPTGYIVKIIVSNSVSVEELWVLYAVMSLMTILGSYNDFGMTESLNYFLPEHIHKKNKREITNTLSIALFTNFITSTIFSLTLFFSAHWLSLHYFRSDIAETLIQILVVQFFAQNLFTTLNTFFQSIQDTKLQKSVDFLRMVFLMIFVYILWFIDLGTVQYYAGAWSISILFWLLLSAGLLFIKYRSYFILSGWIFSFESYKKIFKYAIWVMLSANVGMLLSQIDMQMVVYFLWPKDAGFYTNYLSLIRIPFLFLLPWVYFLFPVFSDLLKRNEIEKVYSIRTFVYELFSILWVIMTSFFLLFWPDLTLALFGPWYETSGKILLYSSPFLLFNFLLQIDFQILSASGKPKVKMYILLAGVVLNIITNYIFLHLWWVVGSAFSSGFGWLFIWLLSFHATRQFRSVFRWWLFFYNILGFFLLSLILSQLDLQQYTDGRIELFLWILCISLIYCILFIIINQHEFRRFYRLFHSKKFIW